MKAMLQALVKHLQENRRDIVREVDVVRHIHDQTYGLQVSTETISVVEFDSLLCAIDDFAETFNHD